MQALVEVQIGQELELDYVKDRLQDLKCPQPGYVTLIRASSRRTPELWPYQVLIGLTGAPNHLSDLSNLLEYKIMDDSHSLVNEMFFPVNYTIFPNGSRLLMVSGLVLDTEEMVCEYSGGSLKKGSCPITNPGVLNILESIILRFPQGSGKFEAYRSAALSDLRNHAVGHRLN